MKKWILLLFAGLLGVTAAQGQSYYYETYEKSGDKLVSRNWVFDDNSRCEAYDKGETVIDITRKDSACHYLIYNKTKRILAMPLSESTSEKIGALTGTGERNVKKEFLANEEVEGYMCKKYRITITKSTPDSGKRNVSHHEWWTDKPFNICIQTDNHTSGLLVTRNIKPGAQPAHLFELPKGYQMMSMSSPAGRMKGQAEATKDYIEIMQNQKGEIEKESSQKTDSIAKAFNELQEMFKKK